MFHDAATETAARTLTTIAPHRATDINLIRLAAHKYPAFARHAIDALSGAEAYLNEKSDRTPDEVIDTYAGSVRRTVAEHQLTI